MLLSTHPSVESGQRMLINQQSHHVGGPNADSRTMKRCFKEANKTTADKSQDVIRKQKEDKDVSQRTNTVLKIVLTIYIC